MIQIPAYSPQRTQHSMSQTQFPNATQPDSIVYSTEGRAPQVDNPWNGQVQTVTTGGIHRLGDIPAQYDQCYGRHNGYALYSYGKFLGLCHR